MTESEGRIRREELDNVSATPGIVYRQTRFFSLAGDVQLYRQVGLTLGTRARHGRAHLKAK